MEIPNCIAVSGQLIPFILMNQKKVVICFSPESILNYCPHGPLRVLIHVFSYIASLRKIPHTFLLWTPVITNKALLGIYGLICIFTDVVQFFFNLSWLITCTHWTYRSRYDNLLSLFMPHMLVRVGYIHVWQNSWKINAFLKGFNCTFTIVVITSLR